MVTGYRQKAIPIRSREDGTWFVDPSLRDRLISDADDQGTNLTDVALRILGARYGVKVEPNGRRSRPAADQHSLHMMMPVKLIDAISRSQNRQGLSTFQDEVRLALCRHYELPDPPKIRRGPKPRVVA